MKKLIFIALFIFFFKSAYSDQLQWLTLEQAEKTISFFEDKNIKSVILWCACCDGDSKTKVKVRDVKYKKIDKENYYEVYIIGKTADGKKINKAVDLAYVHIKRGGMWYCLGKELNFECNPCTEPFKF
jgi:hypothetical protein